MFNQIDNKWKETLERLFNMKLDGNSELQCFLPNDNRAFISYFKKKYCQYQLLTPELIKLLRQCRNRNNCDQIPTQIQ